MRPTIKAQIIELRDLDSEMAEFILISCKIQLRQQVKMDLETDYASVVVENYKDKLHLIWELHKFLGDFSEGVAFDNEIKDYINNYRKDNGLS